MDRLPFKIRAISLEFLGRAVQSNEFLERMLGNGLVIAEMDEFCFFTGNPDSSPPFRLKRLHDGSVETAGTIPFNPTIVIPAYLNDYAVIPLVAGLIEKKDWHRGPRWLSW